MPLKRLKVIQPTVLSKNIEIFPMSVDDIDDVMEIDSSFSTAPWSRELFLNEFKNLFSYNFVAKHDSIIIGYLNFWVVCEVLELNNFAVREGYRNKGIGSFLMEFLIKTGEFFNVKQIFLDVKRDNFPARYLYKRFGFTESGIRKNYYDDGSDAILMERQL